MEDSYHSSDEDQKYAPVEETLLESENHRHITGKGNINKPEMKSPENVASRPLESTTNLSAPTSTIPHQSSTEKMVSTPGVQNALIETTSVTPAMTKKRERKPKASTSANATVAEDESSTDSDVFEVDQIVGHRRVRNGNYQYKIRWVGYDEKGDTWEPPANLLGERARDLLTEYKEKHGILDTRNKSASFTKYVEVPEEDRKAGWLVDKDVENRELRKLYVPNRILDDTEKALLELHDQGGRLTRAKRKSRLPPTPSTDASTLVAERKKAPPKKRGRKPSIDATTAKSASPPAKRAAHVVQPQPEEKTDTAEVDQNEEVDDVHTDVTQNENLFQRCHFLFITSKRRQRIASQQINVREYTQLIKYNGGVVAEVPAYFVGLPENANGFFIARTCCRTFKYLFALAFSIPCVSITWIDACVAKGELVDWHDHMLPAGVSVIDGREFPQKPLKGKLFNGKTIFVNSVEDAGQDQDIVPFVDIWLPLLRLLGAKVIAPSAGAILEFAKSHNFDYMLTGPTYVRQVLDYATEKGVDAVSSNWIIHAMITGELVSVSAHPSFAPASR